MPRYSKGEERFNCISHLLAAVISCTALIACIHRCYNRSSAAEFCGVMIYGLSLIVLYTVSAVYHGLPSGTAKQVMRIVDHCTIYVLIAGTYTPIIISKIWTSAPGTAAALFASVWLAAAVGTVFTSIDLKKYSAFSMACYIVMGWCIVFAGKDAAAAVGAEALRYILYGGISYTVGAVIYGIGKRHKYMHGVFHVLVVAGSALQFVGIYFYVI